MNKFLTAVFAATLLSSTALAKDSTVTVPTPKSITVVCSDDVSSGTIVLSNPPKVSCKDFSLAKAIIGTGITIGPDVNVDRIVRALRQATTTRTARPERRERRNPLTEEDSNRIRRTDTEWTPPLYESNRNTGQSSLETIGARRSALDDFSEMDKKFPGMSRNRQFFVSGTSSCRGWVPIQDIINGKCREGKVRID
jgi:hypothetical protein